MADNNKTPKTFLESVAPWIRGYQLSVYVRGREKPVTGLTVCSVQAGVLIGRWNSSTHLIPLDAIAYIRFAPDCDPCREPKHPLHDLVQSHRPGDRRGHPPAKPYKQAEADGVIVGDIIKNLRLRKDKQHHEPSDHPRD